AEAVMPGEGGELRMDVAGRTIARPAERLFSPTFWAASTTASVSPLVVTSEDGLVVTKTATGLAWVALRNAPFERAFGWLPVAPPGVWAPEDGPQWSRVCLSFA